MLGRNRDFRCVTNNEGKWKRIGLRSTQDEEISGSVEIIYHNKKEIEQRLTHYNRVNFSKVKGLKVCKDKTHAIMLEDDAREKKQKGDINREDCEE